MKFIIPTKISSIIYLLVVLCLLLVTGCNIFEWSHSTGGSTDVTSLLFDADSAYNKGDYTKALEYYLKVVTADQKNSIARYGYARSYARANEVGILNFLKSSGIIGTSIGNGLNPFGSELKKYENVTKVVIDSIDPIARGECDGKISRNDVSINLDLSLVYLLRAIFVLIDPPDATGGGLKFDFSNWSNGTWDLVVSDPTILTNLNNLPNISGALTNFDTSLARLDTAIENSIAADSKNWPEIRNSILNIRKEIDAINKTINDWKRQWGFIS